MPVTSPLMGFEKDFDIRTAETVAKWNHKKDSLLSNLEEFYKEECFKQGSKFSKKIALKVMQAFNEMARSSLEDLLEWVHTTQRSQDDESKRQIKDLIFSIEDRFQSHTSRIERERHLAEQRLLVTARSRPSNPASNPEQKPEKPIPKHRTSGLKRVGSAGNAFERAKVTERIILGQHANWQPRPPRHSRRRQNAMRMEKTLSGLNENSRKLWLYNRAQTYGNPKGPARRTSVMASRPPTAIRLKKRHTRSLDQELNDSELQCDEPDDVPDNIRAKPSFEHEPIASQGYRLPGIGEGLLMDDALVLGQQLNEEFSTSSFLADIGEDSDGGDTEVEQMAEEGKGQQKRDLEEKPQPGPDGTIMLSPYMAMRLWKTLLHNNERIDFAIAGCENLEKYDINASSVNELIDTWVLAIKEHHNKFSLIKNFFADIARHVLEVDLPPNVARKSEASPSSSMLGHSETSAGTKGSQCLSTAPSSGSRDSFVSSDDDYDGDNAEMSASSETKSPVFPDNKPVANFGPGFSQDFSVWQQKIKKNRESVTRGPYLSPPSSAGTQDCTTPQSSPRDGDSPKKWQSSPKEENTPQKDSNEEKEAVSEDKKGDGPAGDMSSNGAGESSSDIPEASQETNAPAPGNSDGSDDPDSTKGATADIESSHSSTKASGIFQSLKPGLRFLLVLVKLFILEQFWAWCAVVSFVYELISWSCLRFFMRKSVEDDGKALKFPNLLTYAEMGAVINHVFFLLLLGSWLDIREERHLWDIANGQTRDHMLTYIAIQTSWVSTLASYYTSSLWYILGPVKVLLSWISASPRVFMQFLDSFVIPLWTCLTDVVESAVLVIKTYKLTGG
ncbi:hypothetical protein J7337_008541 [Fusarium musae]|uniref:Uncharacterized protein n=1 Tax=Fusarium musae TaxID=1042133 RepID=A0A9P8INQ4_9HYPO|nr:hypothetical protein J7337_008541 [Fusarium musae]KAG9500075.1 hypothetical protein J7337_008541 [Fusarium musae]